MEQVSELLIGIVVLLAGIGIAQAQPTPGSTAAASKGAEKEAASFTIENSLTIRDPFRKPLPQGNGNDLSVPELERFDLDKYKLVGVMTGPKKPKALIVAPGGKMHIIDGNTRIGTRHGVVHQIMQGAISVEEKVVNLLGQEESIETLIEMKDENAKKE
ncbi:MAG: pilus assembly protein PilP [Deltaproteobacteria bacterium]|nr:pilus assembly protein PilP [Deltaproteobacteria bacterium]